MTDFKAKMHHIDFGWCSAPDPAGGTYSAPPDPLTGFGGRFAAGVGAGLGKKREKGGEREGGGSGGEAPKLLLNQGPSEPCYGTECNFTVSGCLKADTPTHTGVMILLPATDGSVCVCVFQSSFG